jgi:pseudouridylate synthase
MEVHDEERQHEAVAQRGHSQPTEDSAGRRGQSLTHHPRLTTAADNPRSVYAPLVPHPFQVHPVVADALAAGAPVVALESTIISHGLPRPQNLAVAGQIEQAVRDGGAVPATIAVVGGRVCVGLDDVDLELIATADDVTKTSLRDLGTVAARGGHGATTVAATSHVAARAGIQVFATGGLGGVHRGARDTWDESADLTTLGTTPITVVCSGVKSILDIGPTLERLETLNVSLLGYGTDKFPGFYLTDSGYRLEFRVDSPEEVAAVMARRRELGLPSALVVAHPLPADEALDAAQHDAVLAAGLLAADEAGVTGKDATPFLLDWFHRHTGGASLTANISIIMANAALAARIAVASAAAAPTAPRPGPVGDTPATL